MMPARQLARLNFGRVRANSSLSLSLSRLPFVACRVEDARDKGKGYRLDEKRERERRRVGEMASGRVASGNEARN